MLVAGFEGFAAGFGDGVAGCRCWRSVIIFLWGFGGIKKENRIRGIEGGNTRFGKSVLGRWIWTWLRQVLLQGCFCFCF